MKKILSVVLVLLILCGCGNTATNSDDNSNNKNTIKVDESLLTKTITLPNSFFELFGTNAEEFVNKIGGGESRFNKIETNDDGSVSITMTKIQYNEYMNEFKDTLEESLQEMIDSDNYSIDSIDHNKDYSEFKVKLSTNEVGLAETFAAYVFAMYGGVYQLFDGNENPSVKVIYIGSDGSELKTWDSSELNDAE